MWTVKFSEEGGEILMLVRTRPSPEILCLLWPHIFHTNHHHRIFHSVNQPKVAIIQGSKLGLCPYFLLACYWQVPAENAQAQASRVVSLEIFQHPLDIWAYRMVVENKMSHPQQVV